jgi:hypothetical protein
VKVAFVVVIRSTEYVAGQAWLALHFWSLSQTWNVFEDAPVIDVPMDGVSV